MASRLSPRTLALRLLLLLAALLGLPGGQPADRACADAPPGAGALAMPPAVQEARGLLRRHQSGAALARLRQEGGIALDAPERSWVLAQVAPMHQGLQAVRAEIETLPRSPLRLALLALLSEAPQELRMHVAAQRARSGDPWLALALAHVCLRLGRHEEALGAARLVARSAPAFVRVEAAQAAGRALTELGRLEEAVEQARVAGRLSPDDSRPLALEAELLRRSGRLPEARRALLGALALDPGFQHYARRLAELVREEPGMQPEPSLVSGLAAVSAARAQEARDAGPRHAELLALEGLLTERAGRVGEAVARYEQALAGGANPVPVEHALRVLLAREGRYAACAELLRRALPPEVIASEWNLLAPAWQALEVRARAAPDAAAPEPARRALAETLLAVGAVEEAFEVAGRLTEPPGRALSERLRRHLAFEDALRTLTEAGYREAANHRAPPSLSAYLARLPALADEHLAPAEAAAFRAPATGLRRVTLLGAWLDHSTDTTSPVVAYFRRHGRYLVLGQRNDQPVEAVLLGLGCLARKHPVRTRGQAYVHDLAVGYDRALRAWMDAQGGLLSGACLPDGLWLDADAALDTEHDARAVLTRDASLAAAAARLPAPAADTFEGPFALGDPSGLYLRLAARYVAARPDDRWGSFRTLRAHESGHVIDIRRHLPIAQGLPATLRLLGAVGFAPERMEAVLEGRAQLAAVIDAPDPALALAEMVEMLPVVSEHPEVHAAGYAAALRALVRQVWSRPDLYPAIDRSRRVLPQLHLLSDEQLRGAARAAVGSS